VVFIAAIQVKIREGRAASRLRRGEARGHFLTEQAALECLYLAVMSLDPGGKGRKRWSNRWKVALNASDIAECLRHRLMAAASARDASSNREARLRR
jgi:hypothetical protein